MNTSHDSDRTYYRETPVAREPKRNNAWLPLLLLLPLLFIGGYLLGNNNTARNDQTVSATSGPRFGVGGGPGSPVVSPLPEDDTSATSTPAASPVEDFGDEIAPTMSPSPAASSVASPSASTMMQRTGQESSI